ncbi:MAG: aconitase family protein [Candidatus Marinimicrobia bacterium]|nr:aconitase family protein [Candidatus Neomarinimicrobiota bacterium]
MDQTLIQKILSRHTGDKNQKPGDVIKIQPELLLASNDSINSIIRKFYQSGMKTVANPDRVILINNASPVESIHQSRDTYRLQEFVQNYQIKNYYELGRSGWPSNVVINQGHITPGMITVSSERSFADLGVLGCFPILISEHEIALSLATGELWVQVPQSARFQLSGSLGSWITGTDIGLHILKYYKLPNNPKCILEFSGEGISELPLHERFNLANVLAAFGYDYVLFEADAHVLEFLNQRTTKEAFFDQPDEKADYIENYEINLSAITPLLGVAQEGEEIQIVSIDDVENQPIHKVFIGANGSGRFEDFQIGLKLIRYNPVNKNVQMLIMPADSMTYSDLINNGLAGIFLDLGCEIYPSSFFNVIKKALGIFIKEIPVMTTSPALFHAARNTEGHHIFLGSIFTSFAAAIQGSIIHPKALEMKLRQADLGNHYKKVSENTNNQKKDF